MPGHESAISGLRSGGSATKRIVQQRQERSWPAPGGAIGETSAQVEASQVSDKERRLPLSPFGSAAESRGPSAGRSDRREGRRRNEAPSRSVSAGRRGSGLSQEGHRLCLALITSMHQRRGEAAVQSARALRRGHTSGRYRPARGLATPVEPTRVSFEVAPLAASICMVPTAPRTGGPAGVPFPVG